MTHNTKKHIKNLANIKLLAMTICLLVLATGCTKDYPIELPTGEKILAKIAVNFKDQRQGLSGVKSADFKENEGLLFYYEKMGPRVFWMPNTYFNLDIIFLNKNLIVLDIERNMEAHPGYKDVHKIKKTRLIIARYVLEMRADSKIAKKIKIGMKLSWKSSKSLIQTAEDTRL